VKDDIKVGSNDMENVVEDAKEKDIAGDLETEGNEHKEELLSTRDESKTEPRAAVVVTKVSKDTKSDDQKPEAPHGSSNDELVAPFKLRISQLENENTTLKNKVKSLEAKLKALESENAALLASTDDHHSDLSWSPPPSLTRHTHSNRQPSFVEVDLYGDAGKIKDIRKQMEQFKGWQVDMRSWRTVEISPAFEI
jgi:hypothetical protein